MEKLQAALDKARQTRAVRSTTVSSRTQLKTTPSPDAMGAWEALTPITLGGEALAQHLIVTQEAGAEATPFDILRTKALLQMRQNGWKRLAITSPMPKSGKTTVACNLALGLGRQNDLRSMLFDLDLRDPSVHEFLQVEPAYGIGDVLTGAVPFSKHAVRHGSNLAISMATRHELDPTRLLLSEETAEALDEIEATYKPDVMIFDLPSVLVNDDTRAFLKNVDCALIVARAEHTRFGQFDICEREIGEHTNVLGAVLNACRIGV
ncbi:CpsD/CapB family tyrosine-protein kinase [Rhodovulum visakhapatnamense]|uniref:Mrp family chromosome partitioning ATPase n=1 Tax=Rhodovulum visakhapatnamense TaxID=364297 RepID=A0A4R8FD14_9RHOB|nr:CpsD/CapB family tyrosine-protein kinase [Rhodovulum visakhapatnamense]TDX21578.1 Mrp family chromosome partitioning ATPase [Rhodovulum visakhapatnamense]